LYTCTVQPLVLHVSVRRRLSLVIKASISISIADTDTDVTATGLQSEAAIYLA